MLMDGDVVLAQNNGQKSIAKINQYHKGESTGNYILSSTFYIIFYKHGKPAVYSKFGIVWGKLK